MVKLVTTYGDYLQVVLFVIARVRADKQLLHGVVGACTAKRADHVRNKGYLHNAFGHPLDGEGRPCQRVAVKRVVKERGVFLPNLVLLHYFLLLDIIGVFNYINSLLLINNLSYLPCS